MTQVDGGRRASDGGDHVAGLIAAGVFLIEWVVHRRRQRGYRSRERARWVSSRSCAVTRLSPFKQLLEKHQISEVDFLQIDAEGYDFELLKSIDFSTTRPRFVNYERVLLQGSEEECRKMMRKSGCRFHDWGQDTLCTRT
jgi:hypothetical protein